VTADDLQEASDDDRVQVEEVVVRDGPNGHDTGKRIVESYDVDTLTARGFGDVHSEAFEHVREVTDPRDYDSGTHLATIVFDVVAKTYHISWTVSLGVRQRLLNYRLKKERRHR
jgi:hypothetical protein